VSRLIQRFVTTVYRGPTDHRGSRVIVTNMTTKARITVPWDHALDASENHEAAARHMLGTGPLLSASVAGGGWVWTEGS
jgi:hypothetical protein